MRAIYDPREESGVSWPTTAYPYHLGVTGGLLGAVIMALVAASYGLASGRGIWLPINLIGAALIRELQSAPLHELTQFHGPALLAGLAIHFSTAALIGLLYTLLLPTLPGPPLLWALVVGPLLWLLAFLTLPLVNPVMSQHVELLSFGIAHLFYGLGLGGWVAHSHKVPIEE